MSVVEECTAQCNVAKYNTGQYSQLKRTDV
jgi:hypothetical protein